MVDFFLFITSANPDDFAQASMDLIKIERDAEEARVLYKESSGPKQNIKMPGKFFFFAHFVIAPLLPQSYRRLYAAFFIYNFFVLFFPDIVPEELTNQALESIDVEKEKLPKKP